MKYVILNNQIIAARENNQDISASLYNDDAFIVQTDE